MRPNQKRILSLLLAGTLLFSARVSAGIWVYTCEPANQTERTWQFTSESSGACDGGGTWVELSSFTEQEVNSEDAEEFIAAIAFILVVAFGFRLARKLLLKEV